MTLFNKYRQSAFVKNSLILTIGTATAQFFPLLVYPVLSRVYGPEQFGILATFTSVVSILAVVYTGKYETAVLIAEDDVSAANVSSLSMLLATVLCVISFVPTLLFEDAINGVIGTDIGHWLLCAPFVALSICAFNCYHEWCVRKKYYTTLANNKLVNSLSLAGGKMACAFNSLNSVGLTLGEVFGRVFTAFVCLFKLFRRDWGVYRHVSWPGIKAQARQYGDVPKYTMTSMLLNTLGGSIPIIILGNNFDSERVGYFALTTTILSLPISVISHSVRDVFRQKANELYRETGEFASFFRRVFWILSAASFSVTALVIFFLPTIFGWVLGEQWTEAGRYAQILLPMIALDFVAISLSGVLLITYKLRQGLYWQIYFSVTSIASIYAGCHLWDSIYAVLILFSIARFSSYAYLLLVSHHYAKGNRK